MSMSVNARELANIMDLSERRVNQLVSEGVLQKETDGKFDVMKCVIDYYKNKAGLEAGASYEIERALHEKIKRETAEIELAELRGNMHSATDIKRVVSGMLINFRGKMLAIPATISPKIINQNNPNVIASALTKAIKTALQELSEYDAKLFVSDGS